MKKLFILLTGLVTALSFAQTTITHSEDMETIDFVVGCAANDGTYTGYNSYSRSFVLSDFGITSDFAVTDVTFALSQLTGDLPFSLILSTTDAPYPNGSLTELSFEAMPLTVADSETIITHTYDTPVVVPAGSELVFVLEADGELDLINWRPGGNMGGETAPSYLVAPACGANTPITFESTGFPGHLIMSITGTTSMGTVELGGKTLSVYPNPATDVVNVSLGDGLQVQSIEVVNMAGQSVYSAKSADSVNVSFLPAGIYVVRVKDNKGVTHMSKVVVK